MDLQQAETPRFTIVGAGLAGALMACYLGKAGHRVELFEKRFDPRGHDPEGGRSINLAISVRGIHALGEIGLAGEVLRQAIPMRGRMIHPLAGRLAFQPYGKDDSESIHSVSRAGLNIALLNAASRHPGVRLSFRQKCTGIDLSSGAVELLDEATGRNRREPADLVIGADGVYSAVRAQMQKQERFDYRQEYLSHGYKELTIPAGPGSAFRMEKHALHIWPRHSFMMIALPNQDGSFTCTLFLPYEGPRGFAALKSGADVERFFAEQFPDAVPLMPGLVADFLKNPTGPMLTVYCRPWHVGGKVVLLGDACHAVVPFLGQGMNAAFEDCVVLDQCLARHAPDWEAAFHDYQGQRMENTDTLADLCVENFIEMRDRVSSRLFRMKKRLALLLHRLLPRWYVPLYVLVTFTRTPYAEALRRARRQHVIVAIVLGACLFALLVSLLLLWTPS
jgi:kynurenine 3-monooxygenase